MTARTVLNDLLAEIDAVQEYTEPEEAVRPTDTIHVEAGTDLKKVFTLQRAYTKQAIKNSMLLATGLVDEKDFLAVRETDAKVNILTSLMWYLVSLQFPTDKQDAHGIRAGWKLVVPDISQTAQLADFEESKIELVN